MSHVSTAPHDSRDPHEVLRNLRGDGFWGPVVSVLADFTAHLRHAQTIDPNGAARHTLEHVVSELTQALATAATLVRWGSIKQVAADLGRAESTVTDWAQNYGNNEWCWKKSGVWSIDMQKFDLWYRKNLHQLEKRKRSGTDRDDVGSRPQSAAPGVTRSVQ